MRAQPHSQMRGMERVPDGLDPAHGDDDAQQPLTRRDVASTKARPPPISRALNNETSLN